MDRYTTEIAAERSGTEQTVNLAARIGEYARPGEVLVSHAIVEAAADGPVRFESVGLVGLKGLAMPVDLFSARKND